MTKWKLFLKPCVLEVFMDLRLIWLIGSVWWLGFVSSQSIGRHCDSQIPRKSDLCQPAGRCTTWEIRCNSTDRIILPCCQNRNSAYHDLHIDENSPISQQKCQEYGSLAQKFENVETCRDYGNHTICGVSGGLRAMAKGFPHMALIGFAVDKVVTWRCGGSLISDQYVLTAAHCLQMQDSRAKFIRLGDLDYLSNDDEARPETFLVTKRIAHPDYRRRRKYHDIGLLKMHRAVAFSPYIRPACLPTTHDRYVIFAIATGWGKMESGDYANHLMQVVLENDISDECNSTYASRLRMPQGIRKAEQICAGTSTGIRNTCMGDSGGPLQVFHSLFSGTYSIIGVTSFGIPCGNANSPSVYTRVFHYVGWIEKIVWDES